MSKARNLKVDEALALYRQGLKLIEISRKLDIPEGTVRRWKCTYKWDASEETERSQPKKPNARKRGGQPGNKNATGPPGNKNAERFGFLSKYLPEETLELLHLTAGSSSLDLLWTQIQLAYAIGVARPVSVRVDTFGTGTLSDARLEEAVGRVFDLRPAAIIRDLDLRRPIYRQIAAYGHFGRSDLDLPWEKLDRVEELKAALGV